MHRTLLIAATTGLLALAGCEEMSQEQRMLAGGLTGAALGVMTARALDADDNWVIISGLAGAAVGTLVARNEAEERCAYSNGDGTYTIAAC